MPSHLSVYLSSSSQIVIIGLKKTLSFSELSTCDSMCIMVKRVLQDFANREFTFFELLTYGFGWWLGLLPFSRFPTSNNSKNWIVLLSVACSLLLFFILLFLHYWAICSAVIVVTLILFFLIQSIFGVFLFYCLWDIFWQLLTFCFSFLLFLFLKLFFLTSW